MWAEVKPKELEFNEIKKVENLVKNTHQSCLLLIGVPARKPYYMMCEDIDIDVALSNYHNYPADENRFYSSLSDDEIKGCGFEDIEEHVRKARSARFEFGEDGK